eukprot:3673343-Rhodomonas_salina.2
MVAGPVSHSAPGSMAIRRAPLVQLVRRWWCNAFDFAALYNVCARFETTPRAGPLFILAWQRIGGIGS